MSSGSINQDKHQRDIRDRFIAFAFASSDFLIEIDKSGKIIFTAGQVKSLTGQEAEAVTGNDWLSIFSKNSHDNLGALLKGVQKAGRIGPLMVNIENSKFGNVSRALIMGMTIPDSPHIYLTLNANQSFFDFLAVGDFQDTRLLDEKQFEAAAMKAFQSAKKEGKNLDVTFLEVDKINEYKKSLSFEDASNFSENFQALLKSQSFEGNTASQVDDGKYAIIHDTEITQDFIETKIQELVERSSNGEDKDVGLKTKTIEADMSSLNEREARRALIYTINQIEEGGLDAASNDLALGFDHYLQENAAKITRLKALIGQQAFRLNFQPIVYLPSEDICHYEALVRFTTDDSPYELIVFGEDIGIAPDVDMAILKQAIGYIQEAKKETPNIRIAVNISGQSIQSAQFFDKLIDILDETGCSSKNLMFEITESTAIGDLKKVNRYIQRLRDRKFEVCLDDFGAGAASFQYLNALDIDCVKIDGKYIRDALNSSRDEAMVRNLARMCQDLGVTTVAEMVETQEQLDYLVGIGVDKGQGWLFGKPAAKAEYIKRDK
jgi:EAL domain-containing protein (putative c-di-GMP-specific phosphodiesterase class I)